MVYFFFYFVDYKRNGVLKMKMSELVNELSERIKIYGDAEIVLKNRANIEEKEIFDVFFDGVNFVILFKKKVIF